MPIASFKGKVFNVSSSQVYTMTGMTWGGSLDTEAQEKVGDKPSTYIKGFNLDTMSFEIPLRAELGHNVRAEIESWEEIRNSRSPGVFVLGTKPIGKNRWLLTSVSVTSTQIDNRGHLIAATVKLEFEEYVRAGRRDDSPSAISATSAGIPTSYLVPLEIYSPINKTDYVRDNPNMTVAKARGAVLNPL